MTEQLHLPGTEIAEDKLTTLLAVAKQLEETYLNLQEAKEVVKQLEERNKQLEGQILPDMMRVLGLSELTMSTGRRVTLVVDYFPTIPKDRSAEAMQWLRDHHMSGIIKTALLVDQDKQEALTLANISFEKKESIHPQTLKALVREQCELPHSTFPKELFGVYVMDRATVKEAR